MSSDASIDQDFEIVGPLEIVAVRSSVSESEREWVSDFVEDNDVVRSIVTVSVRECVGVIDEVSDIVGSDDPERDTERLTSSVRKLVSDNDFVLVGLGEAVSVFFFVIVTVRDKSSEASNERV